MLCCSDYFRTKREMTKKFPVMKKNTKANLIIAAKPDTNTDIFTPVSFVSLETPIFILYAYCMPNHFLLYPFLKFLTINLKCGYNYIIKSIIPQ